MKVPLSDVSGRIGSAALGGFGAAAGRDGYRSVKKSTSAIIMLAAMVGAIGLPIWGGLVLGRDISGSAWTWVKSVALTLAGIVAAAIAQIVLLIAFPSMHETPEALRYLVISAIVMVSFLLGFWVGRLQRPYRLARAAIEMENEAFLAEHGIVATGGSDITHYDANETPLRLIDENDHEIVFMVVGRRGKRARIRLDAEGRMIGYAAAE